MEDWPAQMGLDGGAIGTHPFRGRHSTKLSRNGPPKGDLCGLESAGHMPPTLTVGPIRDSQMTELPCQQALEGLLQLNRSLILVIFFFGENRDLFQP